MSERKSNILVFMDLDGTITKKDTMFAFIRHCKSDFSFFTGMLILSPVFILNRLAVIPSKKAKEILLRWFFNGFSENEFQLKGNDFSLKVLPGMLRKRAMEEIRMHTKSGATIVVVTASLNVWCEEWCKMNNLDLISTNYRIVDGKITGEIAGKNCKGKEKVRRIREKYTIDEANSIFAYGDSKGDMDMLNMADIKYYKWKKIE